MEHKFDINIANKLGIEGALVISYFQTTPCVNLTTMLLHFTYLTETKLLNTINNLQKWAIIKIDNNNVTINNDILLTIQNGAKIKLKTETVKKLTNNKFSHDSIEYMLSALLLEKIRENKPDFKQPNLEAWACSIDKLIRIDGKSPERIIEIISRCQKDSFWSKNILSTEKLRKQFDQLELKLIPRAEIIVAQDSKLTDFYIELFTKKYTSGDINIQGNPTLYKNFVNAANNTAQLMNKTKLTKKKIVELFIFYLDREFEKQKTITPGLIGSFYTWKIGFPQYIKQVYPEIKL